MRAFSLVIISILMTFSLQAQPADAKEDARKKAIEDSIKMEKIFSRAIYPMFKDFKMSGVIPVEKPDIKPDPKIVYKLLFELTYNNPDSLAKDVSGGLVEIGRIINLHLANGIPAKNIMPAVIVHGMALDAIRNNKSYNQVHHMDNPSLKLISELESAGAQFMACGQAMAYFDVTKLDLLPEIKVALTAQTVLSSYQLKGYVLYKIDVIK